MKQRIRLTESDLHKVIKESVRSIFKENECSSNELEQAREILVNLTKSTFIPFSSPAPSGTEMEVKKHIFDAIRSLDMAIDACGSLGY